MLILPRPQEVPAGWVLEANLTVAASWNDEMILGALRREGDLRGRGTYRVFWIQMSLSCFCIFEHPESERSYVPIRLNT